MSRFIIVKYAEDTYPQGIAPHIAAAAHPDSYTAKQCGVTAGTYTSREEAQSDLKKMHEFNPTVYYGIVEVL